MLTYFINKYTFLLAKKLFNLNLMETIPYDKRSEKIWFNSELVDWQNTKIHLLSHGLHYASCVFEGERVYDGEILNLKSTQKGFSIQQKRLGSKMLHSQEELIMRPRKLLLFKK